MPTKRKPEPGDVDFQWGVDDPNNVDRLLAEAHGQIDKATQLEADAGTSHADYEPSRIAQLPASLASLRTPDDTRGPVRKFTEPLAKAGGAAMMAAIPAGINPAIGGPMLAGGGLATLPDYVRKMIAPEGDEERPGWMESGGAALAALPATGALSSLRNFGRVAKEAAPFIGPLGAAETMEPAAANLAGRALAYEGGAGARPAGRAATSAVDKLMASPSFANLPRDTARPGMPQGAQSFADAVHETAGGIRANANNPPQGANSFADAVREQAGSFREQMPQNQLSAEFPISMSSNDEAVAQLMKLHAKKKPVRNAMHDDAARRFATR